MSTDPRQADLALSLSERSQYDRRLLEAQKAAEAADRAKNAFLGTISHEILTPINGLMGMAELLLGTTLSPKQRQYAEAVQESARALVGAIDDILDYAKIEAGALAVDTTPFDLQSVLEHAADQLGPHAHQKGIEFVLRYAESAPRAFLGDPSRIRQILLHLVGNALKFTEEGHIFVDVSCLETGLNEALIKIAVEDTGIGVPAGQQSRLFSKFSQLDISSSRKCGGTGLGLAICKRLAALMGGDAGVVSEVGWGSTFWVTLRLTLDPTVPAVRPSKGSGLAGLKALVVHGSSLSRRLLGEQLGGWDMRATAVEHAEAALGALREACCEGRAFDLAIVDADLPAISGATFCQWVKADPDLSGTRLVLLAAPGHGAALPDFASRVAKPVRSTQLLESLTAAMRESPVERPPEPAISGETDGIGPAHILLVEDDPTNRLLAVELLDQLGCTVAIAKNGREAVELAAKDGFAAILMDCRLPEMDGFEATALIRRHENGGRRIPIIAVTANTLNGDRERCLAAGMDDYLSKPLGPARLRERLRRWCPAAVRRDPVRPFAHAAALERMGGSADLLARVAASFLRSLPPMRDQVARGASERNGEVLEFAAHALVGPLGMIAADGAVAATRRLEAAAAASDWTDIGALHRDVEAQLDLLVPALADLAAKVAPAPKAP